MLLLNNYKNIWHIIIYSKLILIIYLIIKIIYNKLFIVNKFLLSWICIYIYIICII